MKTSMSASSDDELKADELPDELPQGLEAQGLEAQGVRDARSTRQLREQLKSVQQQLESVQQELVQERENAREAESCYLELCEAAAEVTERNLQLCDENRALLAHNTRLRAGNLAWARFAFALLFGNATCADATCLCNVKHEDEFRPGQTTIPPMLVPSPRSRFLPVFPGAPDDNAAAETHPSRPATPAPLAPAPALPTSALPAPLAHRTRHRRRRSYRRGGRLLN